MFSPQTKLWSQTPRSEKGQKNGTLSVSGSGLSTNPISPRNGEALGKGKGKGKAIAFLEGDGVMDEDSLTARASKLENELFEYQYNMGLLLIEKKEWTLKQEELQQALEELTDTIKREQAVHSSALSVVEKREENLKKALGVERQCVLDLEKALREMRSEYAEIKFNADSKLAEANALVTSVEEKSLEVEAKFHAVDAKLAEVSRKSSEIERKLQELETQENAFRRERSLFATEREAHDTSISKQREDLREWDRKLREAEERLADGRRLLNQREERANENDNILKEKQSELEELRKKIELSNSALKNKEDDISRRTSNIALKEKEADEITKRLLEKEKQLLEFKEKLDAKEKVEIQKLLDEHKSTLAEKEKEFELEMEQKRKVHDEQLKNKVVEVEKKEVEITHMEEKVKKREQAIEKKLEKVREKEMDLDSKLKALKEKEKSVKIDEKNLERERKEMLAEKEELLGVKAELENVKIDTEKLQERLKEEREQLKVTEEERTELARLQSELKQEVEKYRYQSEQLMKEADSLRQEKEKFEKEWEELDDKRSEIKKEQEEVLEQKQHFEKLKHSEEERLQNEKLEIQQYVERELEDLKLAKESFAASVEHEKLMLAEKTQSEKTQLVHDLEMHKQELEAEMRRKQEEMENSLHDREKSFEQEKEMELSNINYLREVARREMEEMKSERLRIEKEKLEVLHNKQHIEEEQREMKKDIEELVGLSQKLKDQREQFIKERERFIAFAEKQKNCSFCGESIREFMLSDLHTLAELGNLEAPPLPKAAENYLMEAVKGTAERFDAESSPVLFNSGSPTGGGTVSWLRKCTSKIFKFSAGKKLELDCAQDGTGTSALPANQAVTDSPKTLLSREKESDPSLQVVNDSYDVQNIESDTVVREVEGVPEQSQNSDMKARRRGPSKGGRPRASRRQTVQTVTDGSKTNGNAEESSVYTNDDSQVESGLVGAPKARRKRSRAHGSQAAVSDNQTEGHSDSFRDEDRPKRRQRVVVTEQSAGQKRYNLRQPKKSVGTLSNGSLPEERKGKEKENDQLPNRSENVETGVASRAGDGDEPVRSSAAASAFSADSPYKHAGGAHVDTAANTFAVDMAMSEEVNGTADGTRDYSAEDFKTESHGEDDDEQGDDDEVNHPGEASIGKKLWTFLTT